MRPSCSSYSLTNNIDPSQKKKRWHFLLQLLSSVLPCSSSVDEVLIKVSSSRLVLIVFLSSYSDKFIVQLIGFLLPSVLRIAAPVNVTFVFDELVFDYCMPQIYSNFNVYWTCPDLGVNLLIYNHYTFVQTLATHFLGAFLMQGLSTSLDIFSRS